MHAGTIEWNGSDLSRIGKPKLAWRRTPDPAPPGQATRMLVSISVTMDLEALDPATLQARAEWLAESMRVPEGILWSRCGSGHNIEWLATPGDNNLSEVLTGRSNRVELTFTASENHAEGTVASLTSATFTPAGSGIALALHAVRELKEEIRTARHAERNGARSSTTTTHTFTARVAQANPAEPLATRLAYLRSQAEAVKALDTREGVLVIGTFNSIVRVTEFSPVIDERHHTLDVQVQCYAITLPDNGVAECLFETETRTDEGSGEEVTSIRGEISASTRAIAMAKLQSLRAAQQVAGQRVSSYTAADKVIDGSDSAGLSGDDWTGTLSYTLEVRRGRSAQQYTLAISTQKDIRSGMKWSYTGSVIAQDQAAALATARAILTAANHPILTRSDEKLDKVTDVTNPATLHFTKLDFTYEFEGPSDGFISGEIRTDISQPLAGEWRRTVSGFLLATSEAVARARLVTLLSAEPNPLESTTNLTEVILEEGGANKRVAMRLEFNSATRSTRTRAAVEYTDSTQSSISAMRKTRTLSGTVWTNSESAANTILDNLLTSLFGATGAQETTRTSAILKSGSAGVTGNVAGASQWVKLDFSASKISRLNGVTGYDLLEATMTMERTGSINATIITPIPFGRAVAQPATGWIPGRMSLTVSAKAISLATARNWVQGKRAMASSLGTAHETEAPRETSTPEYAPFNGTDVATWSFTGNYSWTYIDGGNSDGIWTAGLPG